MSGHSHFKTIKAQKEVADAKKGKIFSKMGRLITIAAKEAGGDPITNSKLRIAIDQARKFNMPKENIERSIKKGTGELVGEKLEEVSFEGFGPGGIALIVEGITDNKNRTLGEIKTIFTQNGGKLAGEGAVRWMFDKKGVIVVDCKIDKKEDQELSAIEAGAEDVFWHDNLLEIYTEPEHLEKIKKDFENKQIKIESLSLDWIAKEEVETSIKEKEASQRLFEALDSSDDINDIYSNLKA